MKQEECYGLIRDLLCDKVHTSVKFEGWDRRLFVDVFDFVKHDVDLLMSNKPSILKEDESKINKISETLNYVHTKILYEYTDPVFRVFSKAWCHLIKNWNDNVLKNNQFTIICDTVSRLLVDLMSMSDATEVMKEVLARFDSLKNWLPPGYDIAKHFINALDEKTK